MISFHCERCTTFYTVPDDRAGKRTTCPNCKSRLTVPEAEAEPTPTVNVAQNRPPAKVVVLLGVTALGLLTVAGVVMYLLTPNPSKETVEDSLRAHLPPGYSKFQMGTYNRDEGELKFEVTYHEHGDLIGVNYEITRYYNTLEAYGGVGWRVQIIGRRRQWDRPFEKWLMVEAYFDPRGRMVWKRGVTGAGPDEGPIVEERARRIALAVAKSL